MAWRQWLGRIRLLGGMMEYDEKHPRIHSAARLDANGLWLRLLGILLVLAGYSFGREMDIRFLELSKPTLDFRCADSALYKEFAQVQKLETNLWRVRCRIDSLSHIQTGRFHHATEPFGLLRLCAGPSECIDLQEDQVRRICQVVDSAQACVETPYDRRIISPDLAVFGLVTLFVVGMVSIMDAMDEI